MGGRFGVKRLLEEDQTGRRKISEQSGSSLENKAHWNKTFKSI